MSDNEQMRECAQEEQKPAATVMHVRMAKASQADLDTAYRIMNLLSSTDRGYYPSNEEGSPTFFDSDDWEHLQFLHQQIIEIADNSGGVSRVIGAAGILLNEQNGLIDPDDDCIELHPDLKAMNKVVEEAEQLRARVSELEADQRRVSDMVNKAFADGKAEGHGDATAEASVVIGELRARVAELEAWRNAVLDELVSLNIACQEPALYVQTDHFAQARTAPFLARVFQQPIEGVATLPFYAAPPVTAPVRITDEQVEHALRTNGAYESDAAYAMAKDGLLTDARAVETAVLRANGFKVEG